MDNKTKIQIITLSVFCIIALIFSVLSVSAQEDAEDFSDPYYDNTDPVSVGGSATAGAGILAFGLFFVIIWIVLVVGMFALALFMVLVWIFMLIDAVKRTDWKDDSERVTWLLIVALLGGIGAIIYYFAVRHPRGPA